jgi:hypothetical protein
MGENEMDKEEFENEWKKAMERRGSVYIYDNNNSFIHANKYEIKEYYEEDYDYLHIEVYLYHNDIEIARINLSFVKEVI